MKFDWEQFVCGLITAMLIAALIVGEIALFADHTPQFYYLNGGEHGMVCVMSAEPWQADGVVFCSRDANESIKVMQAANGALHEVVRKGVR